MENNSKRQPVKLSEAIKTDPELAEVVKKIKAGEIVFSSGPEETEWTEEDKKRLDEALLRCFGQKTNE